MERILILGGTNFIGRNLVELLINEGKYEITLFNRGITNLDLFTSVKNIKGDRNNSEDLRNLKLDWDYIIDLSCYFPSNLKPLLDLKFSNLKKYIFISTCSVYDNIGAQGELIDEKYHTLEYSPELETITNVTYGNRKAECERLLIQSDINYTILRPSLVYGKYDSTDRFYYWLYNIQKQFDLLVPSSEGITFSITYVKDLINSINILLSEETTPDIYNVTTRISTSIYEIIDEVKKILNKYPNLYKFEPLLLKENGLKEWVDIPLWLSNNNYNYSNEKLLKKQNIKLYNFEESLKETLQYYNQYGWHTPKYGIDEKTKNDIIYKLNTISS